MRFVLAQGAPFVSHPERVEGPAGGSVHPSARFTILDAEAAPASRIALGDGVYIGRGVELTAAGGGSVEIDNDTSLQDGTILYGQVRVGAHCLFGRQVFAASRAHNFRYQPAWLIRDQDAAVLTTLPLPQATAESAVVVEEDCWICQGVVITPGVTIGRGAVIGANSVVTSDVLPYEVVGGVPARRIAARLEFRPPAEIDAMNDDHLPYFYRGFLLSRTALAESRKHGRAELRRQAMLVLAPGARLTLRGSGHGLNWRVNGITQSPIASGPFTVCAQIPARQENIPAILKAYTVVEIENTAASGGIASAEVQF
jgi:acetyltransferase-like isoleucine patch superfamily enzyme